MNKKSLKVVSSDVPSSVISNGSFNILIKKIILKQVIDIQMPHCTISKCSPKDRTIKCTIRMLHSELK